MTKRIITVEPARLAAVAPFAGRKDVRYYLNSVCVEWLPDGRPLLVATNGHVLAAVPGVAELQEDAPRHVQTVLLDIDKVDAVLKAHGRAPGGIAIEFDDIADGKTTEAPRRDPKDVALIASNGARFAQVGVDAKYPEWRRIVKLDGPDSDKDRGTLPITIDPAYMVLFDRASRLIAPPERRSRNAAMATITHWSPDQQVRVTLPRCPEFLGILMPMRADDQSGSLPAWVTRRAPASVKAA